MNSLFFGDNLHVLRKYVKTESVDLVYLDPPFNSNAEYNLLFSNPTASGHRAQIQAFDDTWTWGEEAEQALAAVEENGGRVWQITEALHSTLGRCNLTAYLLMMTVRLIELHRTLKPTGSLYIHCDPTASHYLKIILDTIFGPFGFKNELIWKRTSAHSASKRWADIHDVILFYTKSKDYKWNSVYTPYDEAYKARFKNIDPNGRVWYDDNLTAPGLRNGFSGKPWKGVDPSEKGNHWKVSRNTIVALIGEEEASRLNTIEKLDFLEKEDLIYWPKNGGFPRFKRVLGPGIPVQDLILDIFPVNSQAEERVGYPTQKPLTLLQRIIEVSSDKGDVILDPFCGCGTAVLAAQKQERQWIGIDITHLAIHVIADRLARWAPHAKFEILGQPTDLAGAQELAEIDKYQFQWWATWLCGGQPFGGEQKGRDRGIDGTLEFVSRRGQHDWGIISVKGGKKLNPSMIRDLVGTVAREKASLGVFVCISEPTKEMEIEAVAAGFVELGGTKYRKIQIRTIEQLLRGEAVASPYLLTTAQQAPNISRPTKNRVKAIAPEELQKQRSMLLPILGGLKSGKQGTLPLDEPLLTTQQDRKSRPNRAS
ncbi:DNA methyltransferase [Rhizobium ruizarguesonis]